MDFKRDKEAQGGRGQVSVIESLRAEVKQKDDEISRLFAEIIQKDSYPECNGDGFVGLPSIVDGL